MKNCLKLILMSVIAIAMISIPDCASAQNRRRESVSSSSRSSSRQPSARVSSSSAARRSSGVANTQSRPSQSSMSHSSARVGGAPSSDTRSVSSSVRRSVGSAPAGNSVSSRPSPQVNRNGSGQSSGVSSARRMPGLSANQAASRVAPQTGRAPVNASVSESASSLRERPAEYAGNGVRRAAGSLNRVDRSTDAGPRVHPRERRVMAYDRPGCFNNHTYHYFGYRVSYLPPEYHCMTYWGRTYCCYNGIYYRPWGSYYVVCRPPFGVFFDCVVGDIARAAVTFAFYNNVYRTYRTIDENYNTILEQNRIIAQNNATIATQNSQIALNSERSEASYRLADDMNLVQSYADASTEYFYEDGVFFTKGSDGKYVTIVPPAGALVKNLPDDYEVVTISGVEYYKVDDTLFKLTVIDASPYFEVIGQLTGENAAKYDAYK